MTTCAGPFTAATPGALPADGPFTIAGIELPSGHRTSTGNVWVTDQPTQHAAALWAELAEHYEETGLWPLLYNVTPDRLDPAAVAQSDASAEHLLRDWWQRDIEDLRANIEPDEFDLFTQGYAPVGLTMPHLTSTQTTCRYNALTELSAARAIPTRLALVTVHRPADTLATLGWNGTNGRTDNPADLTTVLRSWEDRLGAYLIAIGDDTLEVIVERPAATDTDRLAWIAERTAFNPDTTLVDDSITLGLLAELPDEPRAVFWWD